MITVIHSPTLLFPPAAICTSTYEIVTRASDIFKSPGASVIFNSNVPFSAEIHPVKNVELITIKPTSSTLITRIQFSPILVTNSNYHPGPSGVPSPEFGAGPSFPLSEPSLPFGPF